MTGPAQAFKVRIIIGTPIRLSLDVVYGGSSDGTAIAKTRLAQVVISLQYPGSDNVPRSAVPTLMPALTPLVSFPAGVLVVGTVA